MKKIFIFQLLCLCSLGFAQNDGYQTNFARDFIPIWNTQEFLVLELAETMPDSLYSFKPTPEMRTFAEQLVHIGHTIDWMYEYVVLEKRKELPKSADVKQMSKQDIIDYLKKAFNSGKKNILSLSEEDLEKKVPFFDTGSLKARYGVLSVSDHITNHRAKINLYLRLCGLTPPDSPYIIDDL